MIERAQRGLMVIVSAPSGTGKTRLLAELREHLPDCAYSISATTRPPREGEVNDVSYHYWTAESFQSAIAAGALMEFAEYMGHHYGTPREPVERWLAEDRVVLFDLDVQGAHALKLAHPECVTVFLLPPSHEELSERLRLRGTDAPDQIARRLARADAEIAQAPFYDYLVINRQLEEATQQLVAIVAAEQCRATRWKFASPPGSTASHV